MKSSTYLKLQLFAGGQTMTKKSATIEAENDLQLAVTIDPRRDRHGTAATGYP
jgi:hypothetical protein